MERKELEVFSDKGNYAIVRMPNRHFPGCVIQGDSLSILLSCAERAFALASESGNGELIGEIEELKELLSDRLQHYAQVLTSHGMSLPYHRPATTQNEDQE